MKKYELTEESKEINTATLYRIRALQNFGNVKEGELGGWIESEKNLSREGNCWVYGNAWVSGNAQVYGDARVYGNAKIASNKDFLYIQNLGSRFDNMIFFKTKNNQIIVKCGCFSGTIEEFIKKVEEKHGDNKYSKEYKLAVKLAKIHILEE